MQSVPAVSVRPVAARGLAAVRRRVPIAQVAAVFSAALDQVYTLGRHGSIRLDGQNVFVYRNALHGIADVDFGVGVAEPFDAIGAVAYTQTPAGVVAIGIHHGDYRRLDETHAAVRAWCAAEGRTLAGTCWEIYGHQGPDDGPAPTEVCYLLAD